MEREVALQKLEAIKGQDLVKMANRYHISIFRNGNKNKGWAGHVIERYLGLPINSSQSPNFGSWELKTISLKYLKSGVITVKETMAITNIDPYHLIHTPFEASHLLLKMQKILIVSRIWHNKAETRSELFGVHNFDLGDSEIYEKVKNDYETVRSIVKETGKITSLSGKMGDYIQPRTKGKGHGSITRAFYARTSFLKKIIILD